MSGQAGDNRFDGLRTRLWPRHRVGGGVWGGVMVGVVWGCRVDQVKSWCGDTRTKVTIKPVIDLNTQLHTDAYKIPDRIRDQVILRDRTCVFPRCTRPARGCDIDHVIPHDPDAEAERRPQPGPTQTDNLACLCRGHHRLKTHSAWRYEMVAPGVFEWTSPHGYRDHHGTTALDPPDPPDIPRPRRP